MSTFLRHVEPPTPATSVLVDLRNFTPSLNAATFDADGTNRFCHFLAEFYGACIEACLTAVAPARRAERQPHVSCTGDGVLVVFMGPWHFAHGLLSGFLLDVTLARVCARGHAQLVRGADVGPGTGFGVGIESGEVSRIHAGTVGCGVETYIGDCINVSARAEAMTKVIHDAQVIVSDTTIERCAEALYGVTFGELRRRGRATDDDAERIAIHKAMNDMNRRLCLTFLDRFHLKGVNQPQPLYRIAHEASHLGTARFHDLLLGLVQGDQAHCDEVCALLPG